MINLTMRAKSCLGCLCKRLAQFVSASASSLFQAALGLWYNRCRQLRFFFLLSSCVYVV